MIVSILNGGIAALNAAGFLLMASGQTLIDYIVISTIFSLASWVYSWILPAAISYKMEFMPQLRLMQLLTVIVASTVMLVTHPGTMAYLFIAMMAIDATLFTQHLLLFRSKTSIFLRMEMVRGLANSAALVTVLLFLDRDPLRYVELLLINVVIGGICLAAASVHFPPSLKLSSPMAAYRLFQTSLFSRQLVTLLSAKGIETGSMIALSQFQLLSPILSLKIGIAVSSALSANARAQRLPVLWLVHMLVYGGGTAAIVLINTLDLQGLPIPETLRLITPANALYVLPIVLSIFTLTVIGLRLSPSAARPVVESSTDH
jgi:hypothetical protein